MSVEAWTHYKRKQVARSKRAARDLAILASGHQASTAPSISAETISASPAPRKSRDDPRFDKDNIRTSSGAS
jgi:hypothetical protein